jgi:hypothetical protein
MTTAGRGIGGVLLLASVVGVAGCPSRELPPPPAQDEPKRAEADAPFCGKVFRDAKLRGGAQCCVQPSAGLLKSADIAAACGVAATAYLGETRDGAACRLYFQAAGQDAKETYAMVSHPVIPSGAPAPMGPDPLLPWKWKKVALRDALGYEAVGAADEAPLLEKQTVLWAGRGRRIVGLHVSKQVCTPAQAEALLQKVIDAVP